MAGLDVIHCAGCVSANTRSHQPCWDDQEIEIAISCTEYTHKGRHKLCIQLHCTKDSCTKRWCFQGVSIDLLDKASHLTAFCA